MGTDSDIIAQTRRKINKRQKKAKFGHNKIMYYNYHAKIKRLVKEGRATGYKFVDEYRGISPCLLIFCGDKIFPIRQHKFAEYCALLDSCGVEKKSED